MSFLAPFRTIQAEVFARLPDEHRMRGRVSPRTIGQRNQPKETHSFLEGPAVDRAGVLHAVDIPWGRIFRFQGDGRCEVAIAYDGEPGGLKFRADGTAIVADQKRGLLAIDFATQAVTPVAERHYSENFRGLNDLTLARNGDVYITDQGLSDLEMPIGRVYRVLQDGRMETVLRNGPSPNGLVLSPDEHTLYVAMTRANAVWRCTLMADGSATRVGVFVQLSGGHGPDGLAMDESGGLVVAHPGTGDTWIFDKRGIATTRIVSPVGDMVTNVCFAPDYRTLYITESHSGTILAARV